MEALPSSTCCFTSIDNLKKTLSETFGFQVGSIGFVKPGHGLKGRQHWLLWDKDLQDMYSVHKKRRVITLWCFRPTVGGAEPSSSRKRSLSEGAEDTAPRPKSHCVQKIKDVEDLISQLKERHGKAFTTEQLSCWAHVPYGETQLSWHPSWHSIFHWLCEKKKAMKMTILWHHVMRVQKRLVVYLLVSELIYVLKVSSSW